jgi:hypothetical protein
MWLLPCCTVHLSWQFTVWYLQPSWNVLAQSVPAATGDEQVHGGHVQSVQGEWRLAHMRAAGCRLNSAQGNIGGGSQMPPCMRV